MGLEHQVEPIPGAGLAADVGRDGRADRDEGPALVSTFRDATFWLAVAARTVRSPCRAAASPHGTRTAR